MRRTSAHPNCDVNGGVQPSLIIGSPGAAVKRCPECGASFINPRRLCCSPPCTRARANNRHNARRHLAAAVRPPRDVIVRECRLPECRETFEAARANHLFHTQQCAAALWRRTHRRATPRRRTPKAPRLHIRCQAPHCARKLTGRIDRMYCSPRCSLRGWYARRDALRKAAAA